MKKVISYTLSFLTGVINIIAGSCGGIIAVENLKYNNIDSANAHATAIAVILPLTIISAAVYIYRGDVKISDSYVYLLPGLIGSAAGAYLLPKIPEKFLSKAFSVFIIYAGVKMFLK